MLLKLNWIALTSLFVFAAAVNQPAMSKDTHPMKLEDLYRLARIADPQLSPKGNQIVYQPGQKRQKHPALVS
jgi:hypothetical protein